MDEAPTVVTRPAKVRGALNLPPEYDLEMLTKQIDGHVFSWSEKSSGKQKRSSRSNTLGRGDGVLYRNDEVRTIRWREYGLSGSLNWAFIPRNMRCIDVSYNDLTGEVEWGMLPPTLVQLWLSSNRFTGEIDFSCLPQTLQVLDLHCNDFSGTVLFESRPKGLFYLRLSRNPRIKSCMAI